MNTKHSKSPSPHQYGTTRGRLPQRAGSPGLNGGEAAATVPPTDLQTLLLLVCAAVGRVKANTALTGEENSADHSGKNQEKNRQQFEISGEQSSALSV